MTTDRGHRTTTDEGRGTDRTHPAVSPIAERLDRLFRTFTKPDGREYSHREVEREVMIRWGEQISHAYIGQLRAGRQVNPTIKPLRLLARFFGVPVEYFTRDDLADEVDQELQLAAQLRELRENDAVRTLVVRARGLSQGSLASVTAIIDHIRRLEGLPPGQSLADPPSERHRDPQPPTSPPGT